MPDDLPPGFEPCHRFDFFEPEDLTALVCLDVPHMQRLVVDQLSGMGYKLHTGLFLEDSLLKLRTHCYDVVIVSEHFNGSSLEEHAFLAETQRLPMAHRRKQFYVLIGASLRTNDELQAFAHSVDLVVGLSDILSVKPVLRRALARMQDLYAPYMEALAGSPVEPAGGARSGLARL